MWTKINVSQLWLAWTTDSRTRQRQVAYHVLRKPGSTVCGKPFGYYWRKELLQNFSDITCQQCLEWLEKHNVREVKR
jgi:hypothetical protein